MKLTRVLFTFVAIFSVSVVAWFLLSRTPGLSRAQTEEGSSAPCCGQTDETPQPAPPAAPGPAAAQPSTAKPDPPGTIDGSKNPELIPDDVAYRMVFVGVAEREDSTEAEKARFRAKIASAGLDDEDSEALFRVLAAFQKQVDALNAQAQEIRVRSPIPLAGTPDYQQLVELSKKRQPVFREAMSALPARLSLEGAAKFQTYVQNEKRRMKYRPDMPPPQ